MHTGAASAVRLHTACSVHQAEDSSLAFLCRPNAKSSSWPCQVGGVSGSGPAGAPGPSLGHCDPTLPSALPHNWLLAPLVLPGLAPTSNLPRLEQVPHLLVQDRAGTVILREVPLGCSPRSAGGLVVKIIFLASGSRDCVRAQDGSWPDSCRQLPVPVTVSAASSNVPVLGLLHAASSYSGSSQHSRRASAVSASADTRAQEEQVSQLSTQT